MVHFIQNKFPKILRDTLAPASWRQDPSLEWNPPDIKGGHIARRKDGRLVLREISQCPQKDLMHFQNILHHSFFNTNNIWIDLEELNKRIRNDGLIRLPMILNPKSLDPKDETSPPVYQVETAMGSAISLFEDARAVAALCFMFFFTFSLDKVAVILSGVIRSAQFLSASERGSK